MPFPGPLRRGARTKALVALLALLALGGCSSSAGAANPQQGYVEGDGATTVVPVEERRPAPALAGRTLDGATLDLADLRGSVVVVNVWASWCPPCRAEAPMLQTVAAALRARGVRFVGIDTRDGDGAAARAFVQNVGLTFPSIVDPDGRVLLAFRDTLPPQAVPSTLIVDREGRVAARVIGPTTEPRLRALIERVLTQAGA